MSKPTNKPGWNSTNVSEPSSTKKSQGWAADEKPSAAQINWLLKTISQWIDHVDLDRVKGETGDAGPVGLKGLTGDAGPDGLKGETGDAGPQGSAGSASLSAADEARLANLENIANVSSPATVSAGIPYSGQALNETLSASTTIDWSVSLSQRIVLSGNSTLSFANGVSGKVYFLSVQQPSGGSATVTWPGNVSWDSGSAPVLSTGGNRKDIFGFYFNGSNYIGYAVSGFQNLPVLQSGSETKNGYIAGGYSGSGSITTTVLKTVEKINFNSDDTISTIQHEFGKALTSTGADLDPINPGQLDQNRNGSGTQSSTHGYRIHCIYSGLPSVNSQTTVASQKLSFANDTAGIANLRPLNSTSTQKRGVIQSELNSYFHSGSTNFGKLVFSTDVFSNYTVTYSPTVSLGSTANNVSFGLSGSLSGVLWNLNGLAPNTGYKMNFSTETSLTLASFSKPADNSSLGWGEAVDFQEVGYYCTGSAGANNTSCHKNNKQTDQWSTLTTVLSSNNSQGYGQAQAATQGSTAGYFCGNYNGNHPTVNLFRPHFLSYSGIKKIQQSSDVFSAHSVSLNQARHDACGFEG